MIEQKIQNPELMMSKHGKSFHFASQVFSQNVFIRISYLYAFCRFVDDTADEQAAVPALQDLNMIKEKLSQTINYEAEYSPLPMPESIEEKQQQKNISKDQSAKNEISVNDLISKLVKFGIKKEYLNVLVDGALFDVTAQKIQNTKDLIRYCYHVAGVVGLMMCPLIFVRDKKAYAFAIDLGIGMQITNICRDVLEDAKNNRTYLPLDALNEANLNLQDFKQQGSSPKALKTIMREHLDLADVYYRSSFMGLAYIPLRPRIAILFASEIYRGIGQKLRRQDFEVLQGRVYLNKLEKVLVSLKALLKAFHPRFWSPGVHNPVLHSAIVDLIDL